VSILRPKQVVKAAYPRAFTWVGTGRVSVYNGDVLLGQGPTYVQAWRNAAEAIRKSKANEPGATQC
jgi:hypothetical protein